ncbi:hypothetical protein [Acinetobacter venetianus]|uniref:hypothetical protein n=1 Tax=Acinetobacter venetianus TaxID=52133 RepID=UPI00241E0EC4|nr:hypothetical protein [Acinetobacter venetianus]
MDVKNQQISLTNGKRFLLSRDDIQKFDSGLITINKEDYLIGIIPTKSGSYVNFVHHFAVTEYSDFSNDDFDLENLFLSFQSMELILSIQ